MSEQNQEISAEKLRRANIFVDANRDEIDERAAKLNRGTAKRLFEKPYAEHGRLDDFTDEDKQLIFDLAMEEGGFFDGDKPHWAMAYNSYVSLMNLIETIRIPGEYDEKIRSEHGDTVANAMNRVGTVFALFRKYPDMSDEEARQLLEVAHSTALAGLSLEARKALYNYASDRGTNPLEVANEYIAVADLIMRVKRNPYPHL